MNSNRRIFGWAIATAAAVTCLCPSLAAAVSVGDTPVAVAAAGEAPHVATNSSGKFVEIWYQQTNTGAELVGQRFASDGSPDGAGFTVATGLYSGASAHHRSAVGLDDAGDFVVAWTDGHNGAFVQFYAPDASVAKGPIQLNSPTHGAGDAISVAMNKKGDTVASWSVPTGIVIFNTPAGQLISSNAQIWVQQFQADGVASGVGKKIATTKSSLVFTQEGPSAVALPSVAVDDGGGYTVAWIYPWQNLFSGEQTFVNARRYSSLGWPLTAQLKIDSTFVGCTSDIALAGSPDGAFSIAWENCFSTVLRRYRANGLVAGPDSVVGPINSYYDTTPAVAMDGADNTFVAWTLIPASSANVAVVIQGYDSSGQPLLDSPLTVHNDGNAQISPSLAANAAGGYSLSWGESGIGADGPVYELAFTAQ